MRQWVIVLGLGLAATSGCGGRSVTTPDDAGAEGGSKGVKIDDRIAPSQGAGPGAGGLVGVPAMTGGTGGTGGTVPTPTGGTVGATPMGGTGPAPEGGTAGDGDDPGTGPGGRPSCDTQRVLTGDFDVSTQAELDELEGVTFIDGTLILELAIENLEPLSCLETVTGTLHFGDPYTLRRLAHLEYLRTVGGDLIFEVTLVPDVETLSGLNHVGGSLQIIWTLNLEKLAGLDGLLSVGRDVIIEGNDDLAPCEAEHLVTAIGRENIGGTVRVLQNHGTSACP